MFCCGDTLNRSRCGAEVCLVTDDGRPGVMETVTGYCPYVPLKAKRVIGQPAAGRTPAARRRPDGGRAGRPGDGDGLTAGPGCAEDRKLTRMVSAGGGGDTSGATGRVAPFHHVGAVPSHSPC